MRNGIHTQRKGKVRHIHVEHAPIVCSLVRVHVCIASQRASLNSTKELGVVVPTMPNLVGRNGGIRVQGHPWQLCTNQS